MSDADKENIRSKLKDIIAVSDPRTRDGVPPMYKVRSRPRPSAGAE